MRAVLDDRSIVKDGNTVEFSNGGEAMRDNNARATFHKCFE